MDRETDASDVSLGGETAKGAAAEFVTLLVAFLGTVVFARLLGASAYGGFYLLLALVELSDRPLRGWVQAGKKRASEVGVSESEILGGLIAAFCFIALLAISGAVVAGPWLRSYTGIPAAPSLFAVLFVSTALYVTHRGLVEARGLLGVAGWSNTLRNWVAVLLQLVLVVAGLGAAGMAYGYALATLLATPVVWYYAAVGPAWPARETLASLWSYARYSIPAKVLGTAYSRLDVLLLGALLTPAAAGHYEVAYRVAMPATFVAIVAGDTLMARASNLASRGRAVTPDVERALSVSAVLALPVFFGSLAIAEELIVTLYGSEYAPAGVLLVGLAAYRVVRSQTAPLIGVVDGLDRPDVTMRLAAGTLAVNLVVGVVLVLRTGPIGVVIATVIAESLRYGGLVLAVRRLLPGVKLFPYSLVEQSGAAVAMLLVVLLSLELVSITSWLHLLAVLAIGATSYTVVLLAVSARTRAALVVGARETRFERVVPDRFRE